MQKNKKKVGKIIMNTQIQKVAFSRFNGVLLNSKKGEPISDFLLAGIQEVLMSYNFTLGESLFKKVMESDGEEVISLFKDFVFPMIKETLGDKEYKTLYPNFPEGVTEDNVDLDMYVLLHDSYLVTYEDLGIEDANRLDVLKSKVVSMRELNLVTDKELLVLAKQLLESNIVLSESDKRDLFTVLDFFNNTAVSDLMEVADIKIKETMIEVAVYLGSRGLASPSLKTATDVLRLIAEMSDSKLNRKHIEFKTFNRQEVRMIVTNLEVIGFLKDDMNTYKKVWKRFFKLFGSRVKLEKYPKVKDAVNYLFGDAQHTTVGHKLSQSLLDFKASHELSIPEQMNALDSLLEVYKKRSGVFARNLLTLISESNDLKVNNSDKYIVQQFLSVADGVNSRIIYQLLDRVKNMLKDGRFVVVSGKLVSLEENKVISEEVLTYLEEQLTNELIRRASKKESMGLVYVDESLKNIAFTTSQKDTNETLHPMTRGSKIPLLEGSEVLRLFVYWENTQERVDIDSSFTFFNDSFEQKEEIAYYTRHSLRNGAIKHSGDVQTAPNGAIEYVDLDLALLAKHSNYDLRYALMHIHSYTQDTFNNMNVRAGVMQLTKEEAKHEKLFKSSAVTYMFDLTSESTSNNPLAFDLVNKELIWLDASFKDIVGINNASNSIREQGIVPYLQYIVNKDFISVYDVLKLNAQSRGVMLSEKPDDTILEHVKVFDKVSDENPLNLAELISEFV